MLFAIDVDLEAELEPVDATAFDLHIDETGRLRQPIWKFVVDVDLEALLAQRVEPEMDELQPAALVLEGQVVSMTTIVVSLDPPERNEAELGQPLGCLSLVGLGARDEMHPAGVERLHLGAAAGGVDLERTVAEAKPDRAERKPAAMLSAKAVTGIGSPQQAQDRRGLGLNLHHLGGRRREMRGTKRGQTPAEMARDLTDQRRRHHRRTEQPVRCARRQPGVDLADDAKLLIGIDGELGV